jgi:hypothetical protein
MNELLAYLDIHGLTIGFTRSHNDEDRLRWNAMVHDLRYERKGWSVPDWVVGSGATMEEAAQEAWEQINAHTCFKVVHESVERRVPLAKPSVAAHA